MALFIVRVELHNASWLDYEGLHSAMTRSGFNRTITADNGDKYHLPTAEYTINSSLPRSTILASAKSAATVTGKGFAVVVTESVGTTWDGLVLVR